VTRSSLGVFFSYLSTDPRACVNCHVMNPQYDAWLKSGRRHARQGQVDAERTTRKR
jgi:hypothetical protein